MASGKRCHYEVLGLNRDCTADEIRSAYKKLALQRHPDKLVQSGLSQAEATAQFQELQHAYEVLSDPKERTWYDSHRSQILFSDPNSANSVPNSVIPNLFSFFSNTVFTGYSDSGKGFYKVYSDVFNKIYANEVDFARKLGLGLDSVREAPVMGNLDSPYTQVTAFYNYWLGFCTVMDFCWVDQYDVMAGQNRKSRRVMEEENKKLRKKAKREYNETVRGLAEFVKKRDKRVIDMAVKRNLEMEKKREEERERKKRLERERMERVRAYEESDWAKVEEEDQEEDDFEEDEKKRKNEAKELYCVVCGKKFKSEKQWKNHEQSKKHKEKAAEFRESIDDEDEKFDGVEDEEEGQGRVDVDEEEVRDNSSVDQMVDELEERFREDFGNLEDTENGADLSNGSESYDVNHMNKIEGAAEGNGLDEEDEEMVVLKAMLARRKNRKNGASRNDKTIPEKIHVDNDSDEAGFMEYDNRKSTRRNRRSKKERGRRNGEENINVDMNGTGSQNEESYVDENSQVEESSSHSLADNESIDKGDGFGKNKKNSSRHSEKKGAPKNETKTKMKTMPKGRKSKATSNNSGYTCETCGEEFESRNKLHKHLGDTGHASLKYQ